MIRLDLPKSPNWLNLPLGVRVRVRPLTTAVLRGAQAEAFRRAAEMREERNAATEAGAETDDLPDLDDPDTRRGLVDTLIAKALARQGIIAWEGVLGAEGDTPAPVTPETVSDLMDIPEMAEAFQRRYAEPLERLSAEGNA